MCFKTRGLFKCGKCPECLGERRLQWSLRLIQEARLTSCFSALLTYSPRNVPMTKDGKMSLRKSDVQKFLKRLRHLFPDEKIKYYIAAEYSPERFRPHYHCLFFGLQETDNKVEKGKEIKRRLEAAWNLGFVGSKSWWVKDDAQVNYATNYLINLYDFPLDDTRERPFRLLSKGISMDYLPDSGIELHCSVGQFGWYNEVTGEFRQYKDIGDNDSKIWMRSKYVRFISPLSFDSAGNLVIDDSFNESVDCVKVIQTKFDFHKKVTNYGSLCTFPMPRVWRERLFTDAERDILNTIKAISAFKKDLKYHQKYDDYDSTSDMPMWKQIAIQKWKLKKKTKKDSLLSNPNSYL